MISHSFAFCTCDFTYKVPQSPKYEGLNHEQYYSFSFFVRGSAPVQGTTAMPAGISASRKWSRFASWAGQVHPDGCDTVAAAEKKDQEQENKIMHTQRVPHTLPLWN